MAESLYSHAASPCDIDGARGLGHLMSQQVTDQISSDWKEKRVLIAALFLPYSISKSKPVLKPKTSLSQLNNTVGRRISFISSVSNMNLQTPDRYESVPVDNVYIQPSTNGNPGLFNAVNATHLKATWIGTIGSSTDTMSLEQKNDLTLRLKEHASVPVFVSDQEMEGHYHQFCKQVLWKPFHYQLEDYPKAKNYEETSWRQYVAVNQHFADTIVKSYQEGDVIWVNDYHLMLVPQMVRKCLPHATIGFFLHIPFPSSEIFRCLHVRKEILMGLLGADMIGFQIYAFMRHFLMTCSRLLALDSNPKGIQLENTNVAVGIYPIGINLVSLNEKRKHPEVLTLTKMLKEKYDGLKVLIGRDKNDYVKGVRHKLLAFERFLQQHPEWHGKVVLIQVALSTTEANESECNVSDVVSRINSRFGTIQYVPVVYLHQDISFSHYLALLTVNAFNDRLLMPVLLPLFGME